MFFYSGLERTLTDNLTRKSTYSNKSEKNTMIWALNSMDEQDYKICAGF